MKTEQSEANAGANTPDGNLSEAQWIADRALAFTQPGETEQEEVTETEELEEVEETEQETEDQETETEQEETEQNEESVIEQLLSGDPEALKLIARQAGTKALGRYAELTAKNKFLEEQLAASRANTKPLPEPLPNNPESGLKTVEEINSREKVLKKVVEDTDSILDENEDAGLDDGIDVGGGQTLTKRQIKAANRNARKVLTDYLPAQKATVHRLGELSQIEGSLAALIPTEVPELADEESEAFKIYDGFRNDPDVIRAKELIPELGARLDYLLAHFSKSFISTRKKPVLKAAKTATGDPPKPKVTGSPTGAAAAPIRSGNKELDALKATYEKTGSDADWIAWRTASKR